MGNVDGCDAVGKHNSEDDENQNTANYDNMAQSEVITADHLPPNPTDMFDFSISEEDLGGPDFAEGDSIIYIIAVITDLAGNVYDHITSPPDVISITIDTIPPAVGTINLETDINDENNSIAVPGYWNIDTDEVTVPLGDLSDTIDTYIEHGKVQLRGSIDSGDWESLASHQLITDENITDFSIVVTDSGGLNGPDNTTGIEEIPDNWDAAVDGTSIEIIARIYDAAGNYSDWPTDPASSLQIDGITVNDRPTILSVSADKDDGWWGPYSADLPILIQLTASDAITVLGGTPFINLETGSNDAVATYDSENSSGDILAFSYTPLAEQTTLDNNDGGRLEFKLDDNAYHAEKISRILNELHPK